jgi:AcrR family transcriptional regulator
LRDPQLLSGSTEVSCVGQGDGVSELTEFHVSCRIGQTCLYDNESERTAVRPDSEAVGALRPDDGNTTDVVQGAARDRIVTAASDLFFRRGIRATGVDTLIEQADVAKSTFYRHFRSKDDLIVAWLRSADARWIDVVTAELDRGDMPPARALAEFWDRLGDWAAANGYLGCPYLKALAEIEERSHPALLEVAAFVGEVDDYFTRTAAAAGFQRPEEVGIRLRLLTMGALTAIVLERSREPMVRARDVAVELLAAWKGITRSQMEALIATPAPGA